MRCRCSTSLGTTVTPSLLRRTRSWTTSGKSAGAIWLSSLSRLTWLSSTSATFACGQTGTGKAPDPAACVDAGSYIDNIDPQDFEGFDFTLRVVASAVSIDNGAWQHVLISSDVPHVFLVVVLNGRTTEVYGHHVLDLNRLYGLDD